ncbi:MAG: hypothetical protein DRP47_03195 [Candidatus Zixiibacteriota bacterium]|nr:MAG: hypothetical protein DRP47_03195 [candidate division Zixibacteria bacterium]
MKKLIPILILLSVGLYLGCGGDDDNGVTPPVTNLRLVVDTTVTDTLLTDALADAWDTVDSLLIDVSGGNPPAKVIPPIAQAIPSDVQIKAISRNDSLYLWLRWTDATFSVWPSVYTISEIEPLRFENRLYKHAKEDQIYVMFDGAPGGGWDVWNWRVLTTGAGGLAEGLTWDNNTLTTDNGNLKVAYDNGSPTGNDPDYCHKDTCEFDGHILLMEDKIHYNDPITVGNDTTYWKATDGWIVGQKIPGFYIDTSLTASYRSDETRGSRWDTRAVSNYESSTTQYTLVLCRKMNTGFAEDIDLTAVDSVKVQIGILDNQQDFILGSSNRGFSEQFWIIF